MIASCCKAIGCLRIGLVNIRDLYSREVKHSLSLHTSCEFRSCNKRTKTILVRPAFVGTSRLANKKTSEGLFATYLQPTNYSLHQLYKAKWWAIQRQHNSSLSYVCKYPNIIDWRLFGNGYQRLWTVILAMSLREGL